MSTTVSSPPTTGRTAAWLGIALAIGGVVLYMVLFLGFGILDLPWYTLAASLVGFVLMVYALLHRRSVWRFVGLFVVGLLILAESWFLFSYTVNPSYAGPLVPGKPFPSFFAKQANGQPFTEKDLAGSEHTVLVFYRGHW
jgi:hypothetical protein